MRDALGAFHRIIKKSEKEAWLKLHRYPPLSGYEPAATKTEAGFNVGLSGAMLSSCDDSSQEVRNAESSGSYSFDVPTGAWTASQSLDKLLGIERGYDHTHSGWFRLIHPDDRVMMENRLKNQVIGQGDFFEKEYRIVRQSDGEVRWVHDLGQIDFDVEGHPLKMRGTIQEITQRKQAELRLQLAASVFTNAQESIMITSARGEILDVNEKFIEITGYTREEVVGKNPRILQSGQHGPGFYDGMWRSLKETGQWSGEIWNRSKRGKSVPQIETISVVRDAKGNVSHYVALAFDISTLKEREERLEHISRHDPLTGLPNRLHLAESLHQALARARRLGRSLAVAYLDLDSFKSINDNHGHDIGDEVLKIVAQRMQNVMREGDTLARLGGDEFVAVLLDLPDAPASLPVINRLLEMVSRPIQLGSLVLKVGTSIGVTFCGPDSQLDADRLLRQADHAMYESKFSTDSRLRFFDSTLDKEIRMRCEAIERLQRGLDANEFVLHYQPKVNMKSGAVVGAEALIRWQHPEKGLLLPIDFLPKIENHPLEVKLGEWVINTALKQIEQWHAIGFDIRVSVNLDTLQLQQEDFAERLAALLAAHPTIKPALLELEILETVAMVNFEKVSKTLNRCLELGVTFALDDFGAGYSSLSCLKELPANMLKIDRSFVRNILNDPADLTVLESILRLAVAFHRDFMAEGVESLELAWMLLYLGCDMAQGYGIARPMEAHRLPRWAAEWSPDPSWADALSVKTEVRQLTAEKSMPRGWSDLTH